MTPQERDLITSLLSRLHQAGTLPKDRDAEALIAQGVAAQPDSPYLLVQTVLIQDMALAEAHNRISDLEQQVEAAKSAPPPQPTSFLGGRGSVPASGPWARPSAPPTPATSGVWNQVNPPQAGMPAAAPMPPPMAPLAQPGNSGGFLRQAATTAAGIAGGALLFQGISSLFGPHYGNVLGGMPMQPGLGESVVNNYYNSPAPDAPETRDASYDSQNDPGFTQADDSQDDSSDQDFGSDQDSGGGSFDV